MLKWLDFILVLVAMYFVQTWCDGNNLHMWILTFLVFGTNIVGFFRGAQAGRGQ